MTELETKLYSMKPRDIAIIVGDVPVLLDEDVGIVLDASSGWRTVVRSDDAPTVVVAGQTKVPQAALQIAALVLRLTGDRVQVLKDRDGDATGTPTVVPVPGVFPAFSDVTAWTGDERIDRALDLARSGQCDGAHHVRWVVDQIVRALLGAPIEVLTADGEHGPYSFEVQGESDAYAAFVRSAKDGEDGPETYEWDTGIAP